MTDEPGPGILTDGKFEGDIDLYDIEYTANNGMDNEIVGHKWDDGLVPYKISAQFNIKERSKIAKGIKAFERKTNCVRLVPWHGHSDYIFFIKGDGCSSRVGRKGGRQDVSIGQGCAWSSTVQHEIVHALGFWHEQSRTDRDKYVIIHYGNIKPGKEGNFEKHGRIPRKPDGQNFDYDYGSLMHYGPTYFGINRKVTIEARNGAEIGQRRGLSHLDIEKINARYNSCHGAPGPVHTHPPRPLPNPRPTTTPPQSSYCRRRCSRRCRRGCRGECGC